MASRAKKIILPVEPEIEPQQEPEVPQESEPEPEVPQEPEPEPEVPQEPEPEPEIPQVPEPEPEVPQVSQTPEIVIKAKIAGFPEVRFQAYQVGSELEVLKRIVRIFYCQIWGLPLEFVEVV